MNQYNPFEVAASVDGVSETATAKVYGGLRRSPYFAYLFFGYIVLIPLTVGSVTWTGTGWLPMLSQILPRILPRIGYQILAIWVTAKRLQNQGYSGWWVLGIYMPVLNILVIFKCLAAPEGYADHKTLDTPAKVIAGVLLAAFVLLVVAIALS